MATLYFNKKGGVAMLYLRDDQFRVLPAFEAGINTQELENELVGLIETKFKNNGFSLGDLCELANEFLCLGLPSFRNTDVSILVTRLIAKNRLVIFINTAGESIYFRLQDHLGYQT